MEEAGAKEVDTLFHSNNPRATSIRKAKHHAILESRKAAMVQQNVARASQKEHSNSLTLKTIVARQQSRRIISSPREYQLELFHIAKERNTIAVLDTGSGKTLIAVLLLRYIADEELEFRAHGGHPRVSFFLTNTVALAFQQSRVLSSNLDQSIELIVGDMLPTEWPQSTWSKKLEETMIIVCTPEVLLHCLFRSFIAVENINLLIFDEAHHAKKNHPYAKIVKEFYMRERNLEKRPRIFGMTASPVDIGSGHDLIRRTRELEALLNSTIAITSNLSMLRTFANRPKTSVHYFDCAPKAGKSRLYQRLETRFGVNDGFENLFRRASKLTDELGIWCSDRYWAISLSETASRKREDKLFRSNRIFASRHEIESLNLNVSEIHEAQALIEQMQSLFLHPSLLDNDLTPKVKTLFILLKNEFSKATDSKSLVFVERKDTARLLFAVAETLRDDHFRPGMITGVSSDAVNVATNSIREQALTILKFRNDELNCLFATSVAEEGIDVPSCNLVIRFDPCKTLIQYIQSRGRARHASSRFIHLIESGNVQQELILDEILEAEAKLEELCLSLPEDRKLDSEPFHPVETSKRTYVEPLTGAKLTYDYSLVVLNHFISCIDFDQDDTASYEIAIQGGKFVCKIVLPDRSPIKSAIGLPYSSKANARRSAAFEACVLLRKNDYINEHFLPIYAKKYPTFGNAHLALEQKSSTAYDIQVKPSFWQLGYGNVPSQLFLTVVSLKQSWDKPLKAIGILTRLPLIEFPSFPIYRLHGEACDVTTKYVGPLTDICFATIEQLTWFTLAIFKDLFNKTFEDKVEHFPYWLAPLAISITEEYSSFEPSTLIDWDLLSEIHLKEPLSWTKDTPNGLILDKFLIDPWHGGRRFFTQSIASGMASTDLIPSRISEHQNNETIMDYSISSLFKASRSSFSWSSEQPVIQAERMMHRLHVLRLPSVEEKQAVKECFICPEPFKVSRLPCDIVSAYLLFPAIVYRLESYLLASEFFQSVGLHVTPALALEAITKSSDNVESSDSGTAVHMQETGPNYERLEFIGDTFLKMATTISVFIKTPDDEFGMHVRRMKMLCNRNLFETAIRHGWFRYIRCESFSRRKWYPPNIMLLEGKGAKTQEQQAPFACNLEDKTIADVCEAMIGASLLAHAGDGFSHNAQFDDAVKAVTIVVENEDHKMNNWSDYGESFELPTYWAAEPTASQCDLARKVARKLPYVFKHVRLVRSAFMHPSQPESVEKLPSYQRLEFLGDALLDMAVVDFLFRQFPDKDPHWLTEYKPIMVSNRVLGAVSVKLGFHKHLRHSNSDMAGQIRQFVDDIQTAQQRSNGSMNYWTLVKEGPKCLADIVESYIGAMFIDSGFDYTVVQQFFDKNLKVFFEDLSIYQDFIDNHVATRLHHLVRYQMGCRFHSLMASNVSSIDPLSSAVLGAVIVHDDVVSQYCGTSSYSAKMGAADEAMKVLSDLSPATFRTRFKCDCGSNQNGGGAEVLKNVPELTI